MSDVNPIPDSFDWDVRGTSPPERQVVHMTLKHRVCINVTDADGSQERVLKGGTLSLPRKIARWLLGEPIEILVLTPGQGR